MRLVIQRVERADVVVDGAAIAKIGRGLLVYVGVAVDDDVADVQYAARKVSGIRIFEDDEGKMNRDVAAVGGQVLAVSNFTLLADTQQGRRPAFTAAAPPDRANELFESFCEELRRSGLAVQTGRFGARMAVTAANAGPINIVLDTRPPRDMTDRRQKRG